MSELRAQATSCRQHTVVHCRAVQKLNVVADAATPSSVLEPLNT